MKPEDKEELLGKLRAALQESFPQETKDRLDATAKVLGTFVDFATEQMEEEIKTYATMFEEKAKANPLSRAAPGLLVAALALRSAIEA